MAVLSIRLPLIVLLGTGCAAASSMGGRAAIRDSAGVDIVNNADPHSAHVPKWRVPDSALVDIGGDSSGPGWLRQVRGAAWFAGDEILVADNATVELRRFDRSGRRLGTIGRRGNGPGEFGRIFRFWVAGRDSVIVWDNMNRRLTLVTAAGTPLGGLSLKSLQRINTIERLRDGSFIFGFIPIDTSSVMNGPTRRTPMVVAASPPDKLALDTVAVWPAFETYLRLAHDGAQSFPSPASPAFGRTTVLRVAGDRLYVAMNDDYEIAEYDRTGRLRRMIRAAAPRRPVRAADRAAFLKQGLAAIDRLYGDTAAVQRTQWRADLRTRRYALTFPFIDDILVADDGALWVQDFQWRLHEAPRYTVFDAAGHLVARTALPKDARPYAVRAGEVLAVWRDAQQRDHVRIYPIRR